MKHSIRLLFILSLFAHCCYAQTRNTIREYRRDFDKIVTCLTLAQKDSITFIGKPVSEFVYFLNLHDVKIVQASVEFGSELHPPQYATGVDFWFVSLQERTSLLRDHEICFPYVTLSIKEGKSYEKALKLGREFKSAFVKEIEEFYSDAVISAIYIYIPDDLYLPHSSKHKSNR